MPHKEIDFNVENSMIDVVVTCFWYWNSLEDFFMSCGVPQQLIVQHLIRRAEGTGNHTVARKVILELKQRNGIDILNRLATQLSRLQGPLNPDKSDPQKAAVALKKLRHALQPNQGP